MPFARRPGADAVRAVADAAPRSVWLDSPDRPDPLPPLAGPTRADLLVIGAGYTGLWTALMAKEEHPERDVVVVEGAQAGWAASGRNGGFCAASLTHGLANGIRRWPDELERLNELGRANLDSMQRDLERHQIECDFRRSGELDVATEDYQVLEMREFPKLAAKYGESVEFLERDEIQSLVHSPTYLAAIHDRDRVAVLDPARLAWGLRRACLHLGVRIFEMSPVDAIERRGAGLRATTSDGTIDAGRIALATNAFPPLLRRLSHFVVPVYDYAIATEPLTTDQWSSIGWTDGQGIGDSGNQFHYYRPTADGRIVFGGYDAIYYGSGAVGARFDQHRESFELLAEHFSQTFPQLAGVRFTHAWGGAIDTCSRFSAFWGTAYDGRLSYSLGYTGLGVAATRFGAQVMLDLLDGVESERTSLKMVSSKPLPFPPEPFRRIGINATRWSLDRADRREGRRNLWLKSLDAAGLGFDS